MKFSETVNVDVTLSLKEKILRIEEFLKEYWGSGKFKVALSDSNMFDNKNLIAQSEILLQQEISNIYAFLNYADYEELKTNTYQCTPRRTEVFGFNIKNETIEFNFYNSDEGKQRERQFQKIVDKFKATIKESVPSVRTFLSKYGSLEVMCHHRSREGFIGFTFSPQPNGIDNRIFIYWEDFEILRAAIVEGYNFGQNNTDSFDDTSRNFISKEGCMHIVTSLKNSSRGCDKEKAFVKYICDWFEQQISENKGVYIIGNL